MNPASSYYTSLEDKKKSYDNRKNNNATIRSNAIHSSTSFILEIVGYKRHLSKVPPCFFIIYYILRFVKTQKLFVLQACPHQH